jgi:hypothetical protein
MNTKALLIVICVLVGMLGVMSPAHSQPVMLNGVEMIDLGQPPLTPPEMNEVMNWIAVQVAALEIPYCWRQSYGNIVDKTITDTYTLSVTAQGGLTANLATTSADHSQILEVGGFVNFWGSDINNIIDTVTNTVRNFVSPSFRDIPLAVVQDFVFPGGKTFAFKTVGFSDHQDLAGHITYADPS